MMTVAQTKGIRVIFLRFTRRARKAVGKRRLEMMCLSISIEDVTTLCQVSLTFEAALRISPTGSPRMIFSRSSYVLSTDVLAYQVFGSEAVAAMLVVLMVCW